MINFIVKSVESGRNSTDTPINSGVSKPRDVATPNSIYEQMNPDGTVKSRAFYDENGNQFSRQDFDHRHFDKKQNNIINHMNITIHIMKMVNRLEKVMDHFLKGIQISQQIKEKIYMINWLENWYSSQCDGSWEHFYGIKIETLDNPGWAVEIDLCETELINKPFVEIDRDISDTDWLSCRLQNNKFEGFGDVSKLYEILEIFRKWVESEISK